MPEKEVQIIIEGPDAESVAEELSRLIRDEFETETTAKPIQAAAARPDERIDPGTIGAITGVAALVLSLPQAVLTVMDIQERLAKKKKADRLIREAGETRKKHPATVIRVRGADGTAVRIETLDGNTLIDIAAGDKS